MARWLHVRSNVQARLRFQRARHDASAIDAKTGEVAHCAAHWQGPEAAQTDGMGHAWVNIEDKAELIEFDTKELKVPQQVSSAELRRAHRDGHRSRPQAALHRLPQQGDAGGGLRRENRSSVPIGEGVDASNSIRPHSWRLLPAATERSP